MPQSTALGPPQALPHLRPQSYDHWGLGPDVDTRNLEILSTHAPDPGFMAALWISTKHQSHCHSESSYALDLEDTMALCVPAFWTPALWLLPGHWHSTHQLMASPQVSVHQTPPLWVHLQAGPSFKREPLSYNSSCGRKKPSGGLQQPLPRKT